VLNALLDPTAQRNQRLRLCVLQAPTVPQVKVSAPNAQQAISVLKDLKRRFLAWLGRIVLLVSVFVRFAQQAITALKIQ